MKEAHHTKKDPVYRLTISVKRFQEDRYDRTITFFARKSQVDDLLAGVQIMANQVTDSLALFDEFMNQKV